MMNLKRLIKAGLMFVKKNKVSPVFVVGCGHSGTSIMISLLDNHNDLYAIKGETYLFYKPKMEVLSTMYDWFELAKSEQKVTIVEKTPMHIHKIASIISQFPKSKVIIMLRDGRDVVCSIRERTGDFEKASHKWVEDNMTGKKYWDTPQVKVVRLEDLTSNPVSTLKRITKFIEVDYSDEMLEKQGQEVKTYYSDKVASHSEEEISRKDPHQRHMDKRNWQINQGLFSSTARWKRDMTTDELVKFRSIVGDKLVQLGYSYDD